MEAAAGDAAGERERERIEVPFQAHEAGTSAAPEKGRDSDPLHFFAALFVAQQEATATKLLSTGGTKERETEEMRSQMSVHASDRSCACRQAQLRRHLNLLPRT